MDDTSSVRGVSSVGVKSAHGEQSEDGFKLVYGGWSVD